MATRDSFRLADESGACGGKKVVRLIFDLPGEKVNKFTQSVLSEFETVLEDLQKRGAAGAIDALVLTSSKPGIFIAGADIELIRGIRTAEDGFLLSQRGQELLNRWEDLPFPTVAAIEGVALGGGCEMALASTAIVMSSDPAAKIGLPEVMLGVIPGMGGCVRLPRKAGLATALDLILTGKTLPGERAYKAGIADGYLPKEGFSAAVLNWVVAHLSALKEDKRIGKSPKLGGMGGPVGAVLERTAAGRHFILKKAEQGVLQKTRGHYPALLQALSVLSKNGAGIGPRLRGKARERALETEARGFAAQAATEISKNLIRIFFLTEAVKKSNGLLGRDQGESVSVRVVNHPAVLGAGVMGGGIAQLFADKNFPVRMKDLNHAALELGVRSATQVFQKQVKKRKLTSRGYLQKLNLISPVLDYQGFESMDFVVEAVVENMEIKKKVFQELENRISDSSIVVTNTSSLSVTEMQSVFRVPGRFAGMHFFNPVHRMPLIEVIRGAKTSDETIATVFEFSKKIGKTPVVVKDAPGFLVNRLLVPYLNEAVFCLSEGMTVAEIDRVLLSFGMPMGPLELIDEVGIDVGNKAAHVLHAAFGARSEPCPLNDKMIEANRLGRKSGKGFFRYEGWKKIEDPAIYSVLGLKEVSDRRKDADLSQDILERCVYLMVNEAARCLEEEVVTSSQDLDLAMIMGTGFPPFRGGLLRYADQIGVDTILKGLDKWSKKSGSRFEPSEPLLKRARNGQRFYTDTN